MENCCKRMNRTKICTDMETTKLFTLIGLYANRNTCRFVEMHASIDNQFSLIRFQSTRIQTIFFRNLFRACVGACDFVWFLGSLQFTLHVAGENDPEK